MNLRLQNGDTVVLDQFCGASSRNTCKLKCGSSKSDNHCYDSLDFGNGYDLQNGAICMSNGKRGVCGSGTCIDTTPIFHTVHIHNVVLALSLTRYFCLPLAHIMHQASAKAAHAC